MIGKAKLQVFPFVRPDGVAFGPQPGVIIYVYESVAGGKPSVDAYGKVSSGASLAYISNQPHLLDRMSNPFSIDQGAEAAYGEVGPPGTKWASFFSFIGYYHVRVLMPNGQAFGIPYVNCPHIGGDRHILYFKDCYNSTLGAGLSVFAKGGAGEPDPTFNVGDQNTISCAPAAAVTNFYAWAGPTPTTVDPFISDNVEAQAQASGYPIVMDTIITEADALGQNANQYTGFGFGWYNAAALPASPGDAGLCILYARWNAPLQWELVIAKGDSTAFEKTVLTNVPAPKVGNAFKLRLILIPGVQARAYVSGVLGATSTNAAKLPDPFANGFGANTLGILAPSIFHQGGNSASADLVTQWWDTKVEVGGKR